MAEEVSKDKLYNDFVRFLDSKYPEFDVKSGGLLLKLRNRKIITEGQRNDIANKTSHLDRNWTLFVQIMAPKSEKHHQELIGVLRDEGLEHIASALYATQFHLESRLSLAMTEVSKDKLYKNFVRFLDSKYPDFDVKSGDLLLKLRNRMVINEGQQNEIANKNSHYDRNWTLFVQIMAPKPEEQHQELYAVLKEEGHEHIASALDATEFQLTSLC